MNKFLIAVLAFAAVATALPVDLDTESQLSLSPNDEDEVANLDGITQVYSSFCLNARDTIVRDVKWRSNGYASGVFGMFFNSAEQLGLEAVEVNKEATEKIAAQIRDPSQPIGEYDSNNAVQSIIAEGQKNIQSSTNQPMSLFAGVVTTLSATKNAVTAQVMSKLSQIKEAMGLNTLTSAVKTACSQFAEYDHIIREQFEAAKAEAVAANPALAKIALENVNCVTAKRIIRIDGVCKLAMAIQSPLIKVITYKPIQSQ